MLVGLLIKSPGRPVLIGELLLAIFSFNSGHPIGSLSLRIKRIIFFLFYIGITTLLPAQVEIDGFGGLIHLDSITVTASRKGFDVADFVDMVRADTSFYQAFDNLRFRSYNFENHIDIFDKKERVTASYYSKAHQTSDGDCRTMEEWDKIITGKFYKRKKKKKHRYYTARLYDELFFTNGQVCESVHRANEKKARKSKMAQHIEELKKLIFRPGEKVNVPIIGKKTAIFEENLVKYYNFNIRSEKYQDRQEAYVFSAVIKPEYEHYKQDKTIIKYLETYFDKTNFQILARNYHLQYNGALFDFDVTMKVDIRKVGKDYIPALVSYDGNWKVATQKRERVKFWMRVWE